MIFTLLLAFLLGFLAWFISTLAAGGAATLLIPIIALSHFAFATAPIITVAALVANPTRVLAFYPHIHWPIARRLMLGSALGGALGAWFLVQLPLNLLKILIALFLISTVFQYRFGQKRQSFAMPLMAFTPLAAVVAFVSGVIGGSGPVLNPFLLNAGLEKEALIATKSINSLFMQLVKLLTYGLVGLLSFEISSLGLAIGLGGALSIFAAKRHLAHINHAKFQQYTLILMVIAGSIMLFTTLLDSLA